MQDKTFTEDDIRPAHLMDEFFKKFGEDRENLLQHKDRFVIVVCPSCGSENRINRLVKNGFVYVLCINCETLYMNPRPTVELLSEYYAESIANAFYSEHIFPFTDNVRRDRIFSPRVQRVINISMNNELKNPVLLEIGPGYGTFCEEAEKSGFFRKIIALEPTSYYAQVCRLKGIDIIELPIEKAEFEPNSIDIIVSFETLEHLFSPKDFLIGCRSVLSEGGLLIITCPNVKGFDIQMLGELSDTVNYQHLNYFHPDSLSDLMETCDFRVIEVLTPGKLDTELVRKKILSGELNISNRPFLERILVEEWNRLGNHFQNFLADNLLSGHMWIVAIRKPR